MKITKEYAMAYRELYEILKYIPKEEYEKLPSELIKTIKENMDEEYVFVINWNEDFEKQKLLYETKLLLAAIFKDYLANKEEKNAILQKEREIKLLEEKKKNLTSKSNTNDTLKRIYEEKSSTLNNSNFFESIKIHKSNNIKTNETTVALCKKIPWYFRVLEYFKNLFRK